MSNPNPHRFPRPPTLPQSKIQIQSQREPNSAETGHLTFATMIGRTGGQSTSLSAANEKEESGSPTSPGSFTTSFDLLSIAKMVPAKQRRVSNPVAVNEGQTADKNTTGESSGEITIHADWRKQPSGTTAEITQAPDAAKPMVFRRMIAIPSSRLVRRSTSIFASGRIKDAKIDQLAGAEDPGTSGSKSDGFSCLENRNPPPLMETLKDLVKEMETPQSGQEVHTVNFPGPLNRKQGEKDDCHDCKQDVLTSDLAKRASEEIFSRKSPVGALGRRMNPTAMFQPMMVAPQISGIGDHIGLTQTSIPEIFVKNCNDNAGILRAVAMPFRPKQISNPASALPSKTRLEGNTSVSTNSSTKLESRLDPFARLLPESFYGKALKLPGANLVSSSGIVPTQKSFIEVTLRKNEESHQAEKVPVERSNALVFSGETMHKKLSLGDAGISQLWNFSGKDDGNQTVGTESPDLSGLGNVNFNPNAISFSAHKTGPSPMQPPNKLSSGQITVRDEAREQIVPIPRNSPSSDLRIVERLEMKAMALSESGSDTVTTVLAETSANDYAQHPIAKTNPVPQMDQRGRRGAISMQGTVKNLKNGNIGDGRQKSLALKPQCCGLVPAEVEEGWPKKWQEPDGVIRIRIKDKGSNKGLEYWPYPYPNPDVSEKEVTTETFRMLYEQLSSYTSPASSGGVKSEKDYWGFGARRSKSGYPPGKEPWFGGDNTSFFDMSFGVNPRLTTGKALVNPPPGLSPTPTVHKQTAFEQTKAIQVESGDLRDLVESSTPDYSDYNDNYRKSRAKTIQEWNLTPIYGSAAENTLNSRVDTSRNTNDISSVGQLVYENEKGEIRDIERDIERGVISARDGEVLRTAMLVSYGRSRPENDMVTIVDSATFEDRVRRFKLEHGEKPLVSTKKARKLVFGSEKESDCT